MSKVIVIGGGRIGSHLVDVLLEGGHSVRVIDPDRGRLADLEHRHGPGLTVAGSGTDASVLEVAGIRQCDVIASVAGADETNLVACSLARFEFGVPRTIAQVIDPGNAWMFGTDMGVDVALNHADILAHLVAEEMSLGQMTILLKLRRGQYSLVEEKVAPGASVLGHRMADVPWPARSRVVGVIRDGELMAPDDDPTLAQGDEILAVVHIDSVDELATLLAGE